MDASTLLENVKTVSARFADERRERQRRRELVPSDFKQLRDAGFLLTGVPIEQGGIWQDVSHSTRIVGDILRTLAHGDSSVALVCAMHPTVLSFWLCSAQAPSEFQRAWEDQRRWVFQTASDGAWWGTITSEPGSGGDIANTRATARKGTADEDYALTGRKHFGSGSGNSSYMLTLAIPEGETAPDLFFLDMQDVPWDGSAGIELIAPWDGHGMIATQSHAMQFENFPVTRVAWAKNVQQILAAPRGFVGCMFTAVIVGIVETALETARQTLAQRYAAMRAYERVEWSRAEVEGWLIQQAYESMVRALEEDQDSERNASQGKTAISELAESVMQRLCRILGGGTFSRHSPFGFWYEDVRALGFLRPPWGLTYDGLFELSWNTPE